MKGKRIVLVGCSSWWIELFGVMKILNKFALLWGEAQKKIAYCYPKVT